MQIVIENNWIIRLTQLFESQEKLIINKFKVKDPNARYAKAMKSGNWDGYHRFYNKNKQIMSKGYLKDLIDLCNSNNIPYDIIDTREKSKYPPPSPNSFDEKLVDVELRGKKITAHKHQIRCWNSVCMANRHPVFEIGTHYHPTGSGKSLMMAGIVKLFRCPTVIITEQTVVLNQLVDALKLFEVVHHDDIGEFYSGKMPNGNLVCIGSIAALQNPTKPILGKIKVKISTLNKNFSMMNKEDRDKLISIIGFNGYLSWIRSNVIDNIKSLHEKNPKLVKDITPSIKKWDDSYDSYVYDMINDFYSTDKNKLIEIIGKDNYDNWHNSIKINDSFIDDLKYAITRFHEYYRKIYFEIAKKSYETLVKKTQELHEMIGKCELLLIDEMDNAASENYDPLFGGWFTGRYIHGFSGTPYDDDKPVEKMKLIGRFGSIISKSNRKELEEIGQIQPIKYHIFQFGDIDQKDKTAFDIAERQIIIDNEKFHDRLIQFINHFPNEKHLIIVDTSNIEILGKALESKIPNSGFIYNKTSQKKRKQMIKDFEDGKIKVFIVSKVGKRGMDLGGGADNLYIIGGGKLRSNFDQIIGRAVRKCDRGWSRVIDFYYTGNWYLLNHSRKKLKHILDIGYTSHIIFGDINMKVKDFVKSRYKIPPEFLAKHQSSRCH